MPADAPTIVATSGGYRYGDRTRLEFNALAHHAVELSGVTGHTPRMGYVGTAIGDQDFYANWIKEAGRVAGFQITEFRHFSMPNHDDMRAALLEQDVVWVTGGSVANLLAVWAVHDFGADLRAAWDAGVVLAGVSAGSICWYQGGCTDSFGRDLQPVTNGLGFLPYANGVHYDNEERRRPTIHRLVGDGTLGLTHCTDDGVGLVYRGTELVEAVTEQDGKGAYVVQRVGDDVVEERIEPRRLPPV